MHLPVARELKWLLHAAIRCEKDIAMATLAIHDMCASAGETRWVFFLWKEHAVQTDWSWSDSNRATNCMNLGCLMQPRPHLVSAPGATTFGSSKKVRIKRKKEKDLVKFENNCLWLLLFQFQVSFYFQFSSSWLGNGLIYTYGCSSDRKITIVCTDLHPWVLRQSKRGGRWGGVCLIT